MKKTATEQHESVRRDAHGYRGYSPRLHNRVDVLIDEWLEEQDQGRFAFAAGSGLSQETWDAGIRQCSDWVKAEYRNEYGVPILGLLLWPFISAVIEFIVRRTLEELFPGAVNGSDSR